MAEREQGAAGKAQISLQNICDDEYHFFLSLGLKFVTCLQVDGGTWLTLTLAVFGSNTEIVKYTTGQVFHLTCSVATGGTVGCIVLSAYSCHSVAVCRQSSIP